MYSCVHTHSSLCDGNNTMEEMAAAAYKLGISVYGFSGHLFEANGDYGMNGDVLPKYIAEARRLKEIYRGKMQVLCGIEAEEIAEIGVDLTPFDYVIGSCHTVKGNNGKYYPVDISVDILNDAVKNGFSGEIMSLVKDYYERFTNYTLKTRYDIIGHFDLITKFNEKIPMFDTQSNEYRNLALSSLDAMLETGCVFEVNTGAISRGWRTAPYPDTFILKRILEKGGRVIITSDTHSANSLDCFFNETEQLLKDVGFKTVCDLTENGFIERHL